MKLIFALPFLSLIIFAIFNSLYAQKGPRPDNKPAPPGPPRPDNNKPAPKPNPDNNNPAPKPNPDNNNPAPKPNPDNNNPAPKPNPDNNNPAPKPNPDNNNPAPKQNPDNNNPAPKPNPDNNPGQATTTKPVEKTDSPTTTEPVEETDPPTTTKPKKPAGGKYLDLETGTRSDNPDEMFAYLNPEGQYVFNAWHNKSWDPIDLEFEHEIGGEDMAKTATIMPITIEPETGETKSGNMTEETTVTEEETETTTKEVVEEKKRKRRQGGQQENENENNGTTTPMDTTNQGGEKKTKKDRYVVFGVELIGEEPSCKEGFYICYVSKLEGGERPAPLTFELRNIDAKSNDVTEKCQEETKEVHWAHLSEKDVLHGLRFRIADKGGALLLQTSYNKMEYPVEPKDNGKNFYIFLNDGNKIGGYVSYSNESGNPIKDLSGDFAMSVHNGILLKAQHPIYSLPFDMLANAERKGSFNVKGTEGCDLRITMGGNYARCKEGHCKIGVEPVKEECHKRMVRAKTPAIRDFKKPMGNKQQNVGYPSGEYPVALGFLSKPLMVGEETATTAQKLDHLVEEVTKQRLLDRLANAPWKKYVEDLLVGKGPNPKQPMDYGYWNVKRSAAAEGHEDVVVELYECTDGTRFAADAYDPAERNETYPGGDGLDFSQDFETIERCYPEPVPIDNRTDISVDRLKNLIKAGTIGDFHDKVLVGLAFRPRGPLPEDLLKHLLAARYQFSLFGENRRTSYHMPYMNTNANNPQKTYLGGHLFGEFLTGSANYFEGVKDHEVTAGFRLPKIEEMKDWGDKVDMFTYQYVINFAHCMNMSLYVDEHKFKPIGYYVPSLVAYVKLKDEKETVLDTFSLIGEYNVDGAKMNETVEDVPPMTTTITTTEAPTTASETMVSDTGSTGSGETGSTTSGGMAETGSTSSSSEGESTTTKDGGEDENDVKNKNEVTDDKDNDKTNSADERDKEKDKDADDKDKNETGNQKTKQKKKKMNKEEIGKAIGLPGELGKENETGEGGEPGKKENEGDTDEDGDAKE